MSMGYSRRSACGKPGYLSKILHNISRSAQECNEREWPLRFDVSVVVLGTNDLEKDFCGVNGTCPRESELGSSCVRQTHAWFKQPYLLRGSVRTRNFDNIYNTH